LIVDLFFHSKLVMKTKPLGSQGCTLPNRAWDTADMYGPYHNEELVGNALQGKRDQVI
jgi:hypothetical protein